MPRDYNDEYHLNLIREKQLSYGLDWGPALPSSVGTRGKKRPHCSIDATPDVEEEDQSMSGDEQNQSVSHPIKTYSKNARLQKQPVGWDAVSAYTKKRKAREADAEAFESDGEREAFGYSTQAASRVRRSRLATPRDAPAPAPADPNAFPPAGAALPRSFYEFRWDALPDPPTAPELRRETFTEHEAGPRTRATGAYDVFVQIWDRALMERIACETNAYARARLKAAKTANCRGQRWEDTDADELYVYLALTLAMAVVVRETKSEYWLDNDDVFLTPGFKKYMTYARYNHLDTYLRYSSVDNAQTGPEAALERVQPLLAHFNEKFQSLYTPGQYLALDNSLTPWLDNSSDLHHFSPEQTSEHGLRSLEVREVRSGYLWRFEVRPAGAVAAATPTAVLRLLAGLEHKGYTLWMDSFYNSPCLARRLKQLGVDCAGTLRTNRQFVPRPLDRLSGRCMERWQLCGLTAGDVDVMVWNGSGRVGLVSTFHGGAIRRLEPGRVTRVPRALADYERVLARLDRKDRELAKYPVEEKREGREKEKTKQDHRLFRRLLNVSVANALAICRCAARVPHRRFRMVLVNSILEKHCSVYDSAG